MPEKLLKHFSIDVEAKLIEKQIADNLVGLYQTTHFGKMLTFNDQIILSEHDGFFFHEMITHPVLFTHSQPEKIAIIGHSVGVLDEVLKHPNITEITCVNPHASIQEIIAEHFPAHQTQDDKRVTHCHLTTDEWLAEVKADTYDIIIQANPVTDLPTNGFQQFFRILQPDGIIVQPYLASLFRLQSLKPLYEQIKEAGFHDWQTLSFPQPSYSMGWRTAMMATKSAMFKRVREKDVFNRTFTTRYYNFDVHQAALALPEFMRQELK